MDFRLNKELGNWIRKLNLFEDGFDVISLAGASKDLASENEEVKNNFLKHLSVSVELHKVERIVIFHHSDCGAYAKGCSFSTPEEEKKKQVEDMRKSRERILQRYPKVNVVLIWGQLKDESGSEIEFETISRV